MWQEFGVLYLQSNTTIFQLVVQQEYNDMFWPYMLVIFRLRSNFSGAAIQEYRCFLGIGIWVVGPTPPLSTDSHTYNERQ